MLVRQPDRREPFRLAQLRDLRDPLPAAFIRSLGLDPGDVKADRPAFGKFEVDGIRYLGLLAPVPEAQWPWNIIVILPEQDYLGAIVDNQRARSEEHTSELQSLMRLS